MAQYKQRADGRYATSVVVNGKKKTIYAKSSAELNKKVVELKYYNNNNISINNDNITLGQFADKWLEINSAGKEDNTIKEYKYIINSKIKPTLGNYKISNIKKYDIQKVVNNFIENGHDRLAKKYLMYIKNIFNEAIQNDIIQKNPALLIKTPTYKPAERRPLSDHEDILLVNCSRTHKYGLFFILIRFTGIRKEEASAIEINDIDFKNNIIKIDKAISFAHNQGKEKATKNRKPRNVYILDIFKKQLEERVEYCKKNKIKYLFTKQTDEFKHLSDSSITNMRDSFLLYMNTINKQENEKAKDIYFTLHQLRHSFCTMLYYNDIGIKEAQELMGHSSADMVYDIYTHLDMEKGQVFDKLKKAIKKYE